ncbi:MAG: beta-lactamase family protein [Clostridiaceae bacterium]|nr:beta-lactamase family protein [Clostridiaceae bacterium]
MDWMAVATRLVSGDTEGIAAYRYRPGQCAHYTPDQEAPPLLRATPESQGIRSGAIAALYRDLDRALELEPHSFLMLRHGRVVAESHWSPYRPDVPQTLYSLSKSLVSTAVGLAVSDGVLDLDETAAAILGFRPSDEREKYDRRVLGITLRHLLTMTSGTSFNEALSLFNEDWVQTFFTSPLLFDPGTEFRYNSMNTYLLSAALRRRTGRGLLAFLADRVFRPIGISSAHWDLCPKGIEKGGWGLSLTTESMARIGQLYLQNGVWGDGEEQTRVLPEAWIREAVTPWAYAKRDRNDPGYGYGYQIWRCARPGAYEFNGAFGQYVIVAPDLDLVIAMTSANGQSFPDSPAERILWKHLDAPDTMVQTGSLPEDPKALSVLRAMEASHALHPSDLSPRPLEEASFHNRMYRMDRNRAGLLPSVIQTVYANFSRGIDTAVFLFDDPDADECRLVLSEGNDLNTLPIGLDGHPRYGTVSIGGQLLQVGTTGRWSVDHRDHRVLMVRVAFIETPDTRIIRCAFRPDGTIRLSFSEIPSAGSALDQINQLIGTLDFANRRLLVYALKRHGTQFRAMASSLLTPSVEGKPST